MMFLSMFSTSYILYIINVLLESKNNKMDSLTYWYDKKYTTKNSGLNVNDLLDNEVRLDDNPREVYKLPCVLNSKQTMKRDDINYGYLPVPKLNKLTNLKETSESSNSLFNDGVVSISVCDYLNTVEKKHDKNKRQEKRTILKLTTSDPGNHVEIYENDIRNIKIKSYAKKFLKKSEFLESDSFISSKSKFKSTNKQIDNKKIYIPLKQKTPLQNLVVQNRDYAWVNLEKYLNTSFPTNPPNSPICS